MGVTRDPMFELTGALPAARGKQVRSIVVARLAEHTLIEIQAKNVFFRVFALNLTAARAGGVVTESHS